MIVKRTPDVTDIDLDVLKQTAPLLEIVMRDTTLRRESASDGGSWAGPCPFCGGTDRFTCRPQGRPSEGLPPGWMCRGCRPKGGTVIDYLIARDGLTFREAVDTLARDHGFADLQPERIEAIRIEVTAAAAREHMRRETARESMAADWGARLPACRAAMDADEALQARLAAEGVGWIARDYFDLGVVTYRGVRALVIPWRGWQAGSDGDGDWRLDAVQLRALDGSFPGPDGRDRRYEFIHGSRPQLFNDVALQPSMGRDYCIVVEGAKKAMSLFNVGEGMVVALASKSAWRPEWAQRFDHFRRVVVALDPDAYSEARAISTAIRGGVVASLPLKVDDMLAATKGDYALVRSYLDAARRAA
ncbi:primase-helicase zinc-binding domain-containing protein [uncultured Piscinibacter sp.]|uniref:primase-helicase zinc-binding domain-containing protein n=1 Tax=uncultured Piscinibacter sp. TaxID=1131835 RepID=UPI00261B5E7E|nr:primase-helicase zinc-binding domain-containing protein [uncultured Piscinibacter sp.]